jgi:hypothetical protein
MRGVCTCVARVSAATPPLPTRLPGVGRRTATSLVASMHGMKVFAPNVTRGSALRNFFTDLKVVMQVAGVQVRPPSIMPCPSHRPACHDAVIFRHALSLTAVRRLSPRRGAVAVRV